MRKKVSCHIITYNQKNFISKCIDGVLMQQTNFSFELIIGDDNSTDGTREILIQYQKKFPKTITLNLRSKRGTGIPGKENFVSTLEMCKGEYISLCDGDDYWTDPLKLQKQVDFLENNTDYSICFTDYLSFHQQKNTYSKSNIYNVLCNRDEFELKDIIKFNFIPTLTVVYRNTFSPLPKEFEQLYPGDWPLHVLNARNGKIKFLPMISAVYRMHESGVCSSSKPIENYKRYLKSIGIMQTWFSKSSYSIIHAFFVARMIIYKDILKYFIKTKLIRWVK